MPGDDLWCASSHGLPSQVRVATATRTTQKMTRWIRVKIACCCWYVVLLVASSEIATTFAQNELNSSSPVNFVCGATNRELPFAVERVWLEVLVDATDKNFTGNCAVNLNFSSRGTDELSGSDTDQQLALLVRVYDLKIQPSDVKCSHGNLTLEVQELPNRNRRIDICDMLAAKDLYILVSEPIRLYLYVWPSSNYRASFSTAFIAVELADFCQRCITPHRMQTTDSLPSVLAVNDTVTSSNACVNGSKALLAAANLFNALYENFTTSPSSCWSVWLAFLRFNSTGPSNVVHNGEIELIYTVDNKTGSCNINEPGPDNFKILNSQLAARIVPTLTTPVSENAALASSCTGLVSVVSTSFSTAQTLSNSPADDAQRRDTGTSTVAIVVGSAVAAASVAVAAVALVVALLVIRSRRIKRSRNSFTSSDHPMTSVSGLVTTTATTSMSNEHTTLRYGEPIRNPPGLAATTFDTSSHSLATTIGAGDVEFAMVDNDLYSPAFGT